MKLYKHRDFIQAITNTAEHFQLPEDFVQKDYFITEALRLVTLHAGNKVIFKGGTSLSKGWNLIDRLSEDVDLFVDKNAYSSSLGKNLLKKELADVRNAVAKHPGLMLKNSDNRGWRRKDVFGFEDQLPGTGGISNRILLECVTVGGEHPTVERPIRSYVSQFLSETGNTLGAEDESEFTMRLLHFRRTFVEKMFAIHHYVETILKSGKDLGQYARHYYDLVSLARQSEVLGMLRSDEYEQIKKDYDAICRRERPNQYTAPPGMSFAGVDALFPPQTLRDDIASQYEQQCKMLCFGSFPAWEEVEACFAGIRNLL